MTKEQKYEACELYFKSKGFRTHHDKSTFFYIHVPGVGDNVKLSMVQVSESEIEKRAELYMAEMMVGN